MPLLFRSRRCAAVLPLALSLTLLLGACSRAPDVPGSTPVVAKTIPAVEATPASEHHDEKPDFIKLSNVQIQAAGIEVMSVRRRFAGAIDVPATLAANPAKAAIVAAMVSGRVVELRRNLGDAVARGDVLAIVESPDAAALKAELATSRQQLELAQSTLQREEYLFRAKVSAEQDYQAARTARQQAQIRVNLASERLTAVGGGTGGSSSTLAVRSPISGGIIAKQASLGDIVAPNTELFRVANLRELAIELSLSPDDASQVVVGSIVTIATAERTGTGRIVSLSRVVDPATLQVRAMAVLPNPLERWRIGEPVRASVLLSGSGNDGDGKLAIPRTAVQTVEDKPSVFVRVKNGFAIKHLTLGAASAGYVIVVAGLDGDEQVATTNSFVLKAELGKGEGGDHDD